MKQFFKITAAFLFIAALFVGPAQAGYDHYQIKVYKDVGYVTGSYGQIPITSGVQYLVLEADSDGHEANTIHATLWNMGPFSAKANPVTFDTFDGIGQIDFWIDDSETSVDIVVVDNNGGFTLFLNGVTPNIHTAVINERPNIMHHGQIWFSMYTDYIWSGISTAILDASHSPIGPFDTGVDILAQTMIREVVLHIVVPCHDSGNTDMGVGFSSDYDAFRGGVQVTNAPAGGEETDDPGFPVLNYQADTNFGDLLYSRSSEIGIAIGTEVIIPTVWMSRESGSLNYSLCSGDDTSDTHDGDPTDSGWGFIHYFFTRTN